MAELQRQGDELVLHLSNAEKAEAVHGDLRVPLPAVRGVEVLDDAHSWTGIEAGFKVGMRVLGVATVATVRGRSRQPGRYKVLLSARSHASPPTS
jgi:hypothetical protein